MKINFNSEDLMSFQKNKRVHLINSLGVFKSVFLVGTSDLEVNNR